MKMAVVTAHAGAECLSQAIMSWCVDPNLGGAMVAIGTDGILPAYDVAWRDLEGQGLIAYFHDDLIIHDAWINRVFNEFNDPNVGVVGFGGALSHGDPNLYKKPYEYPQLGRSDFLSNMVDAEVHGKRFEGACDVAVLDGFALIVRREILEKAGGWPTCTLDYIAYDYWLCCMAHRFGYKIRLVGIPCQHLGGRTYVKLGLGTKPDHWQKFLDAHRYIYNEFKDVLPWSCK